MSDSVIPIDLPLPLPVPPELAAFLLVVFFVLHILFVNLMLGGSLIAVGLELLGLRRPGDDALAHAVAKTITVSKSLAVVLGVGPLLAINVLYTVPWYSTNRITGEVWLLIVPLTITAFLLTYLHKYTWERLGDHKGLHIAIGATASALFLVIPFIFLVNVTLMLFPEQWSRIQDEGFLLAVLRNGVIPRYLHFILASVSATALFLVWWFTRAGTDPATDLPGETRGGLRRRFYTLALVTSALQFLAGPLVLVTLPTQGLSGLLFLTLGAGILAAAVALHWLWRECLDSTGPRGDAPLGWAFGRIVVALGVTVLLMATARHLYRATALAPYQAQVAEKTRAYQERSAYYRKNPAPAAEEDPLAGLAGYGAFRQNCAACHDQSVKLVGPPLKEIASLYGGGPADLAALAAFTRDTGKPRKQRDRAEYPMKMPAFTTAQVDDQTLRSIAGFMIEAGAGATK